MSPVSAWCPINESGVLQIQHIQLHRRDVMTPAGRDWRIVRVVIDPQDAWEAREEARQAIDDLSDTVACAMLGGQVDAWAEDAG